MSVALLILFGLVIIAACALSLIEGLKTGRIRSRGQVISRDDDTTLFWRDIVLSALGVVMGGVFVLAGVIRLLEGQGS